jgi:hypothetical protein
VARKRLPKERKLRTREHILEDLSVNYVERQVFLRGFAVNRMLTDYGLDLIMMTINEAGEIENGYVMLQVKATDQPEIRKDGKTISLRVEVADLKYWQGEDMPVILGLYGQKDKAWWLYVQRYLDEKEVSLEDLSADQDRVTIRIPMRNRLGHFAIAKFRQFRNDIIPLRKVSLP